MRVLLVSAAVVVACRSAPTARPASAIYTPAELAADLDRLESALREGHPSLHKFRTPAEVDSILLALRDSARRPMSSLELWRVATVAVAALRDNHTSIVPNGPLFQQLYQTPGRVLPLRFAVVERRLFVLRSYANTPDVVDGAEVVSIGGIGAREFLDRCGRFVPTDGDVALRARRRIERDFELTCGMADGLPASWELALRAPDGTSHRATIPTVPWRDYRSRVAARLPGDTVPLPPGRLTFTDDSTVAILTVRSFSKQDGFDPKRFIDDAFRRIRSSKPSALIIDVRGNTGGRDTHAARLVAHVARDTFTYYTRRIINKRRFRFLRGTDDWMLNYMTLFLPMDKQPDGRYRLRMALDKPMRPVDQPFTGPVFLLVDGNSISTSSELASVLRACSRATIVGEETGSALEGGTGADVSVVLPNTALILNVPLMTATIAQRAGAAENPARGVMPDVSVEPSLADRLAQRDVVLDSAMTLARSAGATR